MRTRAFGVAGALAAAKTGNSRDLPVPGWGQIRGFGPSRRIICLIMNSTRNVPEIKRECPGLAKYSSRSDIITVLSTTGLGGWHRGWRGTPGRKLTLSQDGQNPECSGWSPRTASKENSLRISLKISMISAYQERCPSPPAMIHRGRMEARGHEDAHACCESAAGGTSSIRC